MKTFSHEQAQKILRSGPEASGYDREGFAGHLSGCSECRAYAALVSELSQVVPGMMPAAVFSTQEIHQKMNASQARLRRYVMLTQISNGTRAVAGLAAALALLLVLILLAPRLAPTQSPGKPELTPLAVVSASGTPVLEGTPTPTSTASLPIYPTADSRVPLNPSGPWLAYRAWPSGFQNQVGEVAVANPDGSGRRKVADRVWSLTTSPASPYLAMLIQPPEFQGVVTGANTLEIVHLPDLKKKTIALLSSPTIQTYDYRQLQFAQIRDTESAIQVIAWAVSHEPPAWSPNGRYLAFTAAIDGPTADLYVYDTQSDQIRRLSDGWDMATRPEWSPDSQWIVHRGINGFGAGCTETGVWAAAVDGSQVQWLNPGECFQITRWIGPHTFETFQPPPGGAAADNYQGAVKRVDIAAGTSTFLRMQPGAQPSPVVDCLTKAPLDLPGLTANTFRSDAPNGKWFVVASGSLRLYLSDGTLVKELGKKTQFNGWQPDSSALVFTTLGKQPDRRSIVYYQPADQILKTFEDYLPAPSLYPDAIYPDQLIWSSTPSGFFLMSAQTQELFYMDPPRNSHVQVEASLGKLYKPDIFWVGRETPASSFQWLACFLGNP